MKILVLEPRGFCAGVERAIRIVDLALEVYGPPIYVRKEIVHNQRVVDDLRQRGAVFVEETDLIPKGNRVVMSAHGVGPQVIKRAQQAGLEVIDATCPLVAKVHIEVQRFV
ncbi:MAG: 4-hydroxy-3-methylbut-2-enyl diphosphate reductase, partial [Verrucomicrobiota bacterium]|nr:4-hydroxy-3-methylbut-2-enyl diphosphate reductase [Verrucomicrobiota bacterium]